MGKKKGGKKGKGKGPAFLFTPEALAPFNVVVNDIVATPLGVQCTVHGVKDGSLYLKWPGGLISPATPAPTKVKDQDAMETYGYHRRPESAHVQRVLDERAKAEYEHRRYQKPAPKTAHMRLPLGPAGAQGSQQYQAYKAECANPGSILRPASAPAKSGGKKK